MMKEMGAVGSANGNGEAVVGICWMPEKERSGRTGVGVSGD